MVKMLKKIGKEIKEEGLKNWTHRENNVIILILMFVMLLALLIEVGLFLEFFRIIKNTDTRVSLYMLLLFIYVFGCIYSIWNTIALDSREFKRLLNANDNDNNKIVVIERKEYLSICFCMAEVIKKLSPIILVFMVNLAMQVSGVNEFDIKYIEEYNTYKILAYLTVCGGVITIINGLITTDILIALNTDNWRERKIRRLKNKFQK